MDDQVRIRIAFDDEEDFALLQEAVAEEEGVEADRPKGITTILFAVLIATGTAPVLGALGKWLRKRNAAGKQKAGVIIDTRKEGETGSPWTRTLSTVEQSSSPRLRMATLSRSR